jgi:hypothetical protein
MDTLFLILLPLVISSLGFLTYRHPTIARQILKPLQYITVGFYFLLTLYYMTQSGAYYKALDATRTDIYKRQDKELNIDSIYKTVKDKDSIDFIMLDYKYQINKSYEIDKYQTALKDSIQKNIEAVIKSSRETNNTYSLYCLVAFLIIITLFGLTFLFDNIHNKEKVNDINNSNDQAE